MAAEFLPFDDLVERVADATFDRPPAIVCNAHITGLGVARALDAHGVPVVALDRTGDGAAPFSDAVAFAGEVTYPLDVAEETSTDDRNSTDSDGEEGFRGDLETLAAAMDHDPVAFGCMDEWALALASTRPDGIRLPFAPERVDAVLDKESLYATAEELGVPYPETYRLSEVSPDAAADALGFPLVVKPARKREFEEAVGTNVIEVATRQEFDDVVEHARDAGVRIMAQEKVPVAAGEDCSLASYVPPTGDPLAVTGNARVRYPRAFGTSCVVDVVDAPEIADRALTVLAETGYHGISEAEFVYDAEREEYVLLDINTRPWKWIGLPVAAGANLPMAAYADAVGREYDPADETGNRPPSDTRSEPAPATDARWVYLPDYLSLLASDDAFADVLSRREWLSFLSGAFEDEPGLTTGVYRPADPEPLYRVLRTEFGGREYYCAC